MARLPVGCGGVLNTQLSDEEWERFVQVLPEVAEFDRARFERCFRPLRDDALRSPSIAQANATYERLIGLCDRINEVIGKMICDPDGNEYQTVMWAEMNYLEIWRHEPSVGLREIWYASSEWQEIFDFGHKKASELNNKGPSEDYNLKNVLSRLHRLFGEPEKSSPPIPSIYAKNNDAEVNLDGFWETVFLTVGRIRSKKPYGGPASMAAAMQMAKSVRSKVREKK